MVDAGDDLDVEFEPLHHDENGGELAEHGEPAQPQDRIQADIAARMAKIGGGDVGHAGTSSRARLRTTNSPWIAVGIGPNALR